MKIKDKIKDIEKRIKDEEKKFAEKEGELIAQLNELKQQYDATAAQLVALRNDFAVKKERLEGALEVLKEVSGDE